MSGGGQAISYCINASLTLSAIAHAVSCSFLVCYVYLFVFFFYANMNPCDLMQVNFID